MNMVLKYKELQKKIIKKPLEFCDEISQTFKDLSKTLNLSNNDFIRTTENRHHKSVKKLWNILEKKEKYIFLNILDGIQYLMKLFILDDEVEEKNGNENSKTSGSPVEWVEEESYFFKLSKWQDKLLDLYEKNQNFILPKSRKNEVVSFVKSGLKDLSVSRKSFLLGNSSTNK